MMYDINFKYFKGNAHCLNNSTHMGFSQISAQLYILFVFSYFVCLSDLYLEQRQYPVWAVTAIEPSGQPVCGQLVWRANMDS